MTAAKKTALGMPDLTKGDPAAFDLDGWLTGATVPQRHITVYADRATADKVIQLWKRIQAKQTEIDEAVQADSPTERTLGDAGPDTELLEMVAEFEALKPILDGCARSFVMEPLPFKKDKAIIASLDVIAANRIRADKPMSDTDRMEWLINQRMAAAIVSPKITVAQFERIRAAIGELQLWQFTNAYGELMTSDEGVDTDFSLPLSAHPLTTE